MTGLSSDQGLLWVELSQSLRTAAVGRAGQ